ncbi:MAG TPA: hypothetical protein DDW52_20840 [Planctomycetaceae bacterium]|nr:hypothetical protein [Planctomycetaceae bacterium]
MRNIWTSRAEITHIHVDVDLAFESRVPELNNLLEIPDGPFTLLDTPNTQEITLSSIETW